MHRRARKSQQVRGRGRLPRRPEGQEEEVSSLPVNSLPVASLLRHAAGAAFTLCLLACGPGSGASGGASSAADAEHPLLGAAAPAFELEAPSGKQKISLG